MWLVSTPCDDYGCGGILGPLPDAPNRSRFLAVPAEKHTHKILKVAHPSISSNHLPHGNRRDPGPIRSGAGHKAGHALNSAPGHLPAIHPHAAALRHVNVKALQSHPEQDVSCRLGSTPPVSLQQDGPYLGARDRGVCKREGQRVSGSPDPCG